MAIFGAILPRFAILAGWVNDQAAWQAVFGSGVWLLGGFLFFPWTTLIYSFAQRNGLSLINLIFLACALAIDLGPGVSGSSRAGRNTRPIGTRSRSGRADPAPVGAIDGCSNPRIRSRPRG